MNEGVPYIGNLGTGPEKVVTCILGVHRPRFGLRGSSLTPEVNQVSLMTMKLLRAAEETEELRVN